VQDLFFLKQFFDQATCDHVVAAMKSAQSSAATVYGRDTAGSINESVRRTRRVQPSREIVELVTTRLWACKAEVESYFGRSLNECEDPQFLHYRVGDFFVAHQDGNTGLLRLDTERRLVSTVIFLSRESELPGSNTHCGGSLVITDLRAPSDRAKVRVSADPGTLVAFRSETTHEVTPVTHGERFSIASWYR